MRWTSLIVATSAVAACGGTDAGALLTVVAEEGPTSAGRIELVLANAKESKIQDVDSQRVAAGDLTQEPVRYYRQRAIAGEVIGIDRVDGFRVRIEPNEDLVAEAELIPFLIAYDAEDRITGIGSYMENGKPAKIEIRDDLLRVYDITMVAMAQTTGEDGIAAGEVVPVSCGTFRSGLAFQPGDVQFRLLLPDHARVDDATDASDRPLDMDCDDALADRDDCDDLRGEFHAGATETCDGMDHDCDSRRLELVTCGGLTTTCGDTEGVQLCQDSDAGSLAGTCVEVPECGCAGGNCASQCILAFDGPADVGTKTMCDPQVNPALNVPGCGGSCSVEVLRRPGDEFDVEIALENDRDFTTKLTNVPDKIQLRVTHQGPNPVTAAPATAVGGVFLAVTPTNTMQPQQISIGLVLANGPGECSTGGNGNMSCSLDQ